MEELYKAHNKLTITLATMIEKSERHPRLCKELLKAINTFQNEIQYLPGSGIKNVSGFEFDSKLVCTPKFHQVMEICICRRSITASVLQRHLGWGYGRSSACIEWLERIGAISAPDESGGLRDINFNTIDEFDSFVAKAGAM